MLNVTIQADGVTDTLEHEVNIIPRDRGTDTLGAFIALDIYTRSDKGRRGGEMTVYLQTVAEADALVDAANQARAILQTLADTPRETRSNTLMMMKLDHYIFPTSEA